MPANDCAVLWETPPCAGFFRLCRCAGKVTFRHWEEWRQSHRSLLMRFLITLTVVCLSVSLAAAQDSKPASKPAKDTKEATDKMISSGMVTGRLLNWGSNKKEKETLTLEIT